MIIFDLLWKVKEHVGHNLTVATYGDKEGKVWNYSIECNDCNVVLESWDVDEDGEEVIPLGGTGMYDDDGNEIGTFDEHGKPLWKRDPKPPPDIP